MRCGRLSWPPQAGHETGGAARRGGEGGGGSTASGQWPVHGRLPDCRGAKFNTCWEFPHRYCAAVAFGCLPACLPLGFHWNLTFGEEGVEDELLLDQISDSPRPCPASQIPTAVQYFQGILFFYYVHVTTVRD